MTRPAFLAPLLAFFLLLPEARAQDGVCPQIDYGSTAPAPGDEDDRLVLTADEAEISQDGLSTLAGTVRLIQGGAQFETQALSYDEQARQVRVQAESVFRNRSLIIRSRSAEFDLARETGAFLGTEFTLVDRGARGAAETIRLSRGGAAEVEDVYFTTCPPDSRAWFLEASGIELDHDEGLGTAKHARLRFGYVPILYAPWFQFPIDDRRRSGFLFPVFGETDTTGVDLRFPVYLNLAPNYDLRLVPRYMSRRGTQLGSEGRYLTRQHTGRLAYEFLDNDEELERRQFENTERYYADFEHHGLINRRLSVDARYGEVSDLTYFEDLTGQLDAASITHLERSARFTYAAPAAYTITARVTDYQAVNPRIATDPALAQNLEPYRRLPELRFDALTRNDWYGARIGVIGEYVNFVRDLEVPNQPRQGQRLDLNPFLRFEAERSAWYVTSEWDWRYTRYKVAGTEEDPARSLPVLSVEGGLRFERLTGSGELQTLEPRLYYLYVPFRNQLGLPIFDSGEPDFDFVQLFDDNRFSGEDRISDANHLAAAFTTRLLDPADGVVRLSASLGQIYRFTAPRVVIDDPSRFSQQTPDRGGTDYLVGLEARLSERWSTQAATQWSPDENEIRRNSFALRFRQDGRRADLAYRYRRDVLSTTPLDEALEQGDLALLTPLWGGWSALGRWRYSLTEHRSLEALAGIEYQTCCWSVRAAGRRYQFSFDTATNSPEYTNGIYVQLELRGLARIGAGFRDLLPLLDEGDR